MEEVLRLQSDMKVHLCYRQQFSKILSHRIFTLAYSTYILGQIDIYFKDLSEPFYVFLKTFCQFSAQISRILKGDYLYKDFTCTCVICSVTSL